MSAIIDDTYAEAFRSIYAEVLVTAANRRWLDHAVAAATGNASSSILCDCEAGLSRYTADTPDGRPGAVLQFHVPRFWKEREQKLERALLVRVSQNVLTCPTTAAFNVLPTDPNWFPLGRKVAYFGDGHQFKAERFGRRVRVIPILSGEFVIERRFGWADGLMGGNLWFFGGTADGALTAAERAVEGAMTVNGVSLPFPGGVAASGSKAGSKYKFAIASTYAEYCPTLRGKPGVESRLPDGVASVQEIIINGPDLKTLAAATQAAIAAAKDTPDLLRISAGNYGGRLGKSFVHLHPDKQPA
jgi:formylmethanofuran--tetrahydromethanopterin N-formyltransferase